MKRVAWPSKTSIHLSEINVANSSPSNGNPQVVNSKSEDVHMCNEASESYNPRLVADS